MAGSKVDGGLGLGCTLRRGRSMLKIIKMLIFRSRLERTEDSTDEILLILLKGEAISSPVLLPPNMEPGWGEREGKTLSEHRILRHKWLKSFELLRGQ